MVEADLRSIPNFLTAESPMGLRRKMLMNNAKLGGFVRYFDIGQVTIQGRLLFIAWFFSPIKDPSELTNPAGGDT